jgi:hypothetical protein
MPTALIAAMAVVDVLVVLALVARAVRDRRRAKRPLEKRDEPEPWI